MVLVPLPPPSLGIRFLSPASVFVCAVPGLSSSFGPWLSLLVSLPWFQICYFLLLSLSSVPSVVPASFRVIFLVLVSAVVWLTFLLSSSPPVSKLRSGQLSFLPGRPAVRFFTAASCSLPGWASVNSGRLSRCWLA